MSQEYGIQGPGVLLLAQKDDVEGEGDAGAYGDQVSQEIPLAEGIGKKEQHAAADADQGEPMLGTRILLEEKRPKERHVYRSSVLQENRVGRCRKLVREDEKEHGGRVGEGRPELQRRKIYDRLAPQDKEQKNRRDGAANARDGEGLPIQQLYEDTGGAPQKGATDHGKDTRGLIGPARGSHRDPIPQHGRSVADRDEGEKTGRKKRERQSRPQSDCPIVAKAVFGHHGKHTWIRIERNT
ncbi:hypothetical protein SDC9_05320 [bioreactor metagenome]|uniref:Uncharacterized protein n=1 Tax=bioreactor metagenome TaxID=1076179 RepID=A0A644SYR8_9ZZZZ